MMKFRTQIKVTMILGAITLLAGYVCHLALTDIYHREADVTLEWNIVRVCALVVLVFIVSTMVTLWRALRVVSGMVK
jgi:hypothetical protein